MKIKNRNKNYKARLLRNSCILAAGVLGISGATAGILSHISHGDAFATNQVIRRTGLNSIGENEIQMLGNTINLSNADIVTTGQVKKMISKCYTAAEIQNGTYDSERNSQVSYLSAIDGYCDSMNVVYDFGSSLARGTHSVNGTISLTWSNAAHDADGNSYDVKMFVDNITVANGRTATRPISLMAHHEHAVRYATQEVAASGLTSTGYPRIPDVGAYYDVTISVVNHGTSTPVTGKMTVYQMKDLDQADHYPDNENNGLYTNSDGSPKPFAEGVTLISGIDQEIFVGSNSSLNITDTHYGSNTRYSATRETDDDEWELSSIAFRGDASGFKYRWHGSDCGTAFGWIGSKKVTTSTSGTYKNNGKITPTDNEVLWKEDKSIVVTPDPGYYVSKITVDGQEINFTPDPDTGKVVYTFDDVIANHTIDAQFAPYNYKVTVRHYKEGTTTPVADPVVSDNHHAGDTYTSQPADVDGYRLVERPDPETVTFTDRDIEMIYYYAPVGNITVEYCDVDTKKCDLTEIVTDEGIDGDESRVCVEKKFDGYNFVNKEGDDCILSKDTTKIKYWYKKQPKNPVTADINVGGYAAAALGLITTAISFLLVIAKRRK